MTRRSTRAPTCLIVLALPLAGCATPRELRRPVPTPALEKPVALPDLPAYQPPIAH
jgi:hypothetical protein